MEIYKLHDIYHSHVFEKDFKCECGAKLSLSKRQINLLNSTDMDIAKYVYTPNNLEVSTLRDLIKNNKMPIVWEINGKNCQDRKYIEFIITRELISLSSTKGKILQSLAKLPLKIRSKILKKTYAGLNKTYSMAKAFKIILPPHSIERGYQILRDSGIMDEKDGFNLSVRGKYDENFSVYIFSVKWAKLTFTYNRTREGTEYMIPVSFSKDKRIYEPNIYKEVLCSSFQVGRITLKEIHNLKMVKRKPIPYNISIQYGKIEDNIIFCDKRSILSTPFGSIILPKGIYKAFVVGIPIPKFIHKYMAYRKHKFTPTKELWVDQSSSYPHNPVDNLLIHVDNAKTCG